MIGAHCCPAPCCPPPMGFRLPNGEQTQRIGLAPDNCVEPTTRGLRACRDELSEAAVTFLLDQRQ